MTPLDAALIRERAATKVIGREIVVVEETGSTNDLLFEMANVSTPEGLVIFAESQSDGRGQRGNRWISAPGSALLFSMLLRPQLELRESSRVTTWLAERIASVARAEFALDAAVKPPNDVYVSARKISGVLVEMRAIAGAPHVAIAGIGINANQREFPEELGGRAASIALLIGREIDRNAFAAALLRDFDQTYAEVFG